MKDNINQRESSMINFMDEIDKASKARQASERFQNSDEVKRKILENKKSEAKGICFDIIFNKIYKDALPMNDEYKIAHGTELDDEFRDFINVKAPNGLECYLHESMKNGNNVAKMLIESVNKIVRDYYFEASMNLDNTDVSKLDFDPNTDENHKKIEAITDKMDTEEISDIIKQNVKQAAISDIQNTKTHQEEMKNLVDELKNDPQITSEAAIDRRLGIAGVTTPKFYQPSLFEGIMINKLNLIKEATEEVSPEDANKKAFFDATKEMTKLSVLNAMKLEDVFHNQNKIANDYAKMRVKSSKINFQEGVDDMLKEQRDSLFNDNGDYFDEGANLEVREFYKEAQKKFKLFVNTSKKEARKGNYDVAVNTLKKARGILDDCYDKIQEIDAGGVGSQLFAWLLTGWFPVMGRCILSSLIPLGRIVVGMDLLIKRFKVICNDSAGKGVDSDDFNVYKNSIKVKLNEYRKAVDRLIIVYEHKRDKESD